MEILKSSTVERRPNITTPIVLDSCAITHIKQNDRLYDFYRNKVTLHRTCSIISELEHPNTPIVDQEPTQPFELHLYQESIEEEDQRALKEIEKIMIGNSTSRRHSMDAQHLFYAVKDYAFFITEDKRILSKGSDISEKLHDINYGLFKDFRFQFVFDSQSFMMYWYRFN